MHERWFQTFQSFKPFKPLPLSSPASRGRTMEREWNLSVALERLERLEREPPGE